MICTLEGWASTIGHRMIDTLIVKNFRCFESLEMRDFARINIIVGENASGKTALLESLFFGAGGSPDMGFRLRAWRGGEMPLQLNRTNESYGTLWQELFFDQDSGRRICAEIHGSAGSNYKVEVFYGGIESSRLPLNGGFGSKDSPLLRLITFKGKDAAGKEFEVTPDITSTGLGPVATGEGAPVLFFSSTMRPGASETAQRFSNLRKEYKHQALIDVVAKEFSIKGLDIEIESGTSYIFADVGGPRKLRLGLVSGGLEKLVSILIGIQTIPHGAILIDEIENGIHYTKLQSLWSIIRDFACANDTQIFASTHSWECLKAAQATIERHPADFGLIRTEFKGQQHSVKQFNGKRLLGALKQSGEIR
jgi:hypothetical protein